MHAQADMTEATHTFGLVFTIPGIDSLEEYLDAFAAAGCDDAAFMGPATDGTFLAEFDRESPEFVPAVASAIDDLRGAVPGLQVLRVTPDDLVTVSAIADRTGRSDESIRLLIRGDRGPGAFPPAAGRINEKTQIWRWADVAKWFEEQLGERPPGSEHARFIAALNHALELAAVSDELREHPDELAVIAHFMPPLDHEALATA
jgi:hypothetical protein